MQRIVIAWTILFACCSAAIVHAIYPNWGSVAASLQALTSVLGEFIIYPATIAGLVCLLSWVGAAFPPPDREGAKVQVKNPTLRFYLYVFCGVTMAYLLGLELYVLARLGV